MFGWMEMIGQKPSADIEDAEGVMQGMMITGRAGIMSDMAVATDHGWRRAAALRVGDRVLTFDNGFQPVRDIQRETFRLAEGSTLRPVVIPKDALGNDAELQLMPEQGIMVESDTVQDILDDPFVVIPAHTLCGFRGIHGGEPDEEIGVTTLAFAEDQVIYVEGGLLAYCPCPRDLLASGTETIAAPLYEVIGARPATYLVRCLIVDDDVKALVCDPEELAEVARRSREAAGVPA
ncbi:Hint domain-containing protein [Jhaorihella thermophila]|uniref:Hint domain-containing protein n=1 Tax=Jhaorihella thermophila TaxID=488547 RepID=A0A1H5RMK6_9RHOB|nr:Hint domain-containing protein [Jhaorihella thermophila]SEF39603.1 Hint domain-containing protein [Jhaorihella thermophila]